MDGQVEALAGRQQGLVSISQAKRLGLSKSAVGRRVEAGRWQRVLPGVYRLAAAPRTKLQTYWASILWAGKDALLSHRAAGFLWGFDGCEKAAPEVCVPTEQRLMHAGILVHRSPVPAFDRSVRNGLPVTGAVRTLVDLCAVSSPEDVERALESAIRAHIIHPRWLRRRLRQTGTRGRTGTHAFVRSVEERDRGLPPRSALEIRLFQALRAHGLPLPKPEYEIWEDGVMVSRVDFAYPAHRLYLEGYSRRWHPPERFEEDARRRTILASLGWREITVTAKELRHAQRDLMDRILLALRNSPPAPPRPSAVLHDSFLGPPPP